MQLTAALTVIGGSIPRGLGTQTGLAEGRTGVARLTGTARPVLEMIGEDDGGGDFEARPAHVLGVDAEDTRSVNLLGRNNGLKLVESVVGIMNRVSTQQVKSEREQNSQEL